jgi:predicted kinase
MKELFLVRGLPGAGKSKLAKSIAGSNGYVKEADMYFVDGDGNYRFNPKEIKLAHDWCLEEVDFFMRYEHKVVVSNTFTQEWEMKPYFDLAEKYGYQVHSIIVENRHGGVNVHGVPEDKMDQMEKRFEIKLK